MTEGEISNRKKESILSECSPTLAKNLKRKTEQATCCDLLMGRPTCCSLSCQDTGQQPGTSNHMEFLFVHKIICFDRSEPEVSDRPGFLDISQKWRQFKKKNDTKLNLRENACHNGSSPLWK